MEQHFLGLLGRYGTPVLFFAQMFGIFGVPIPDELLLTVAGALVRRGSLHPVPTIASAIGGCMSGITLSYVIGRTVGVAALRRLVHIPPEALDRGQRWFCRFGAWLLTFGYFVPGVRHVTAIAAGSSRLSFRRFALYAYPGAALWSTVFVVAGYVAGERWRAVGAIARGHAMTVAIAVIAAAGLYFLVAYYRSAASRRTT